ncbi:MAG: hypothetical protein ACRD3D_02825 [Terriglobia bacterium]
MTSHSEEFSPERYHLGPASLQRNALIVGIVCLALCLIELFRNPTQFYRSYLFGEVFWLGIALSCMGILMLHHLVSGVWGFVLRRSLEAAARTIGIMALFFIPVIIGMHNLYIWSRPAAVAVDPILQQKTWYLNTPGFIIRAIIYFAIWITIGYFLTKWDVRLDESGDPELITKMRNLSGPGIAIYGFTVTFAGFDWVMSLEPHFFSTIYGMMFVITEAVGGMAFIIIVAHFLTKREPMSEVIQPSQFHDFGNLLFVFTFLWAYLGFSQFLIIWSGNLQNEIPWYTSRINRGWAYVALALVILHFAVPFLLLLQRVITFRRNLLMPVACMMFVMSVVDLYWILVPAYNPVGPRFHWSDWLALIGIGGIFLSLFTRQLRKRPLVPLRDPNFVGVLQHE